MKQNRLVVADKGWAETAPEWLKKEIEAERTISSCLDLVKKGTEEVGDAELCLYLYTLNLKIPVDHETGRIYLYVATKLMKRQGVKVPEDIGVKELTEQEQSIMRQLKQDLWRKCGGKIHNPITESLKQTFKESKIKEQSGGVQKVSRLS